MDDQKTYLPLLNIEEVLPIVNKIAILGGLSQKQLYVVFRLLETVSYSRGDLIFKQGENPRYIYVIRSGEVKIVVDAEDKTLELITFHAGDCFGETSVIGIQPHSTTAIAVEDTELIVLSRHALFSIFEQDKELFSLLILNIAREACRRLHLADRSLLEAVFPHQSKSHV